jgi:hypothetical protein
LISFFAIRPTDTDGSSNAVFADARRGNAPPEPK